MAEHEGYRLTLCGHSKLEASFVVLYLRHVCYNIVNLSCDRCITVVTRKTPLLLYSISTFRYIDGAIYVSLAISLLIHLLLGMGAAVAAILARRWRKVRMCVCTDVCIYVSYLRYRNVYCKCMRHRSVLYMVVSLILLSCFAVTTVMERDSLVLCLSCCVFGYVWSACA